MPDDRDYDAWEDYVAEECAALNAETEARAQ